MNQEQLKSAVYDLSEEQRIYVFSRLAHNLTISARGLYSDDCCDTENVEKLCAVNEVQHKISGQLMHLASKDGNAQADDTFIDFICNFANRRGCDVEVMSALKYTLRSPSPGAEDLS